MGKSRDFAGKIQALSFSHLFAFAHLAFCAAAILARPSGLIFLRFRGRSDSSLGGIPRFRGAIWPVSNARTCSSFENLCVNRLDDCVEVHSLNVNVIPASGDW